MIQIYHNPRCGKSRACVAHCTTQQIPYTLVHYLDQPPSVSELEKLLELLAIRPIELVRTKEKIWIEKYQDNVATDKEIIQALALHPILIERPIVVSNGKAVIARSLERILEIY